MSFMANMLIIGVTLVSFGLLMLVTAGHEPAPSKEWFQASLWLVGAGLFCFVVAYINWLAGS